MSKTTEQSTVTIAEARERFTDNSLSTLSPSRVVVMCFDRIDRDLETAAMSMEAGETADAAGVINHAQEIISHLLDSIEASDWEHSDKLSSIYTWAYGELFNATVRNDATKVGKVRGVLAPLGAAFTSAAATIAPGGETSSGAGLRAKA